MKISTHLTYEEVYKSQTATRKGIDNTPNEEELNCIIALAEKVFEPIRLIVSEERGKDSPLHISSCFRCVELNRLIGGSPTSQHCKGQAMDIDMDGFYDDYNNVRLFNTIKNKIDFDQLIWEFGNDENPEWVHVSYNTAGNRKMIIKAINLNGKTTYVPF